ncbi:uncharacterized protein LOC110981097 isoform X2 [Acanthaster planci]|uniref:Uncharacterized protein LOC110981097 isoform X2 n=1 Tax=Acanthaster planci TaxID=133434 RepID=A0A8B7YL81_ACAPL|nr:uncharacterized protein LOC110981097 isoform X2 [Acanthaster planci]
MIMLTGISFFCKIHFLPTMMAVLQFSLLMLFLVPHVTEMSATTPLVSPKGVCISPSSRATLRFQWKAVNADPNDETLQVTCYLQNGTAIVMKEPQVQSIKYCTTQGSWVLETTLTVQDVTANMFSFCNCSVMKNGEVLEKKPSREAMSKANIWTRNDSMLLLSQEDVLITPGKELDIKFDLKCDDGGWFEVIKIYDDGHRKHLEFKFEGNNQGQEPFILIRDGLLPLLRFPALRCSDAGRYLIIYWASRNFVRVETQLELRVHANESTCPKPTAIAGMFTGGESLTKSSKSHDRPTCNPESGTCNKVAIGIGFPIMFALGGACVYIFMACWNRHHKKKMRVNKEEPEKCDTLLRQQGPNPDSEQT